jgi:CDP-diacylglycerol--inositol 3-phosphatidyltransferase
MPLHPRTCSLLYSVSCLLDALDGYAARYYNQSTTFGAVLDMVTDRCTTACLLVFLSSAWPRWSIIFQSLISLDLASHYMHMYATLSMGGASQSHKNVEATRSWILYQYYHSKVSAMQCLLEDELMANRACRQSFSFAVPSMNFSSLVYICSPFRLLFSPPLFFKLKIPVLLRLSLAPGAPELWSLPGQTRLTASGLGLSPESPPQSWL